MLKLNLRQKVLTAFIFLAIIPLAMVVYYSSVNLHRVENILRSNAANALDAVASEALIFRAEMVAVQMTAFLAEIESDLHEAELLERTPQIYKKFSDIHDKEVWYLSGDIEKRENLRLYSEIAFIAPDGVEQIKISEGRIVTDLKDLSNPANTTYLKEDYFQQAKKLPEGEIYVGHVTGFHVGKTMAGQDYYGTKFKGHIRFAQPVYENGELAGVVTIALDHRHLMEFTQHITPASEKYVPVPSYSSGNYSFMFDNQGWIITHPKHWDIRGVDKNGELVPPYTENSTEEDIRIGRIPYNLFNAGFIHQNYPLVASDITKGISGVVDVTNVGGSQKMMAYAPIIYSRGVYKEAGVFGGITIGSEMHIFHEPADDIAEIINIEISKFINSAWGMVWIISIIVIIFSYRLAHGITKPINKLYQATKNMTKSDEYTRVDVDSADEVGQLADSFNIMANELETRRARLVSSLRALEVSRAELIKEESFKTTVFENIETGIITVDENNIISFINSPACKILKINDKKAINSELCGFLNIDWPEIVNVLQEALRNDDNKKWDGYLEMERNGRKITFRLAVLPLHYESLHGRILTVEDLTERVIMRKQMGRMEQLASMGRLSAGLAHEIRNPLTGVSILLDDLHDRMLDRQDDQVLIRKSLQEMERLETLVNELLSFAKVQSSEFEEGDLRTVVSDVVFLVQKQCEKQNIKLKTEYDGIVSSFPQDSARLKQAFINIITNAIDSMKEGGELSIRIYQKGQSVRANIKDTGAGISKERLEHIFEPFYTTKKEGSGLGLAITHNIISEHNGEIRVESTKDKGTEFIIIFRI